MLRLRKTLRAWVPRWWRGEGGALGAALGIALGPAEAAFRGIATVRNLAYDRGWLRTARGTIPVVSIGNLGVGGAGKTPFAAWVTARLRAAGLRPAIVLRGYGADEIYVHRELNPGVAVISAPRRIQGVKEAARRGHDVAVLDDAFQHRALSRDLDIVLIAAESWGEQRRLLPRGPWREPADALRRADLVVVTRKSASSSAALDVVRSCRTHAPEVPTAICHLRPTGLLGSDDVLRPLASLAGESVLAVASLADPAPFLAQLREGGAAAELMAFPDHHAFTAADVEAIRAAAGGRAIVCTRKEAVKLTPLAPDLPLLVMTQEVVVEHGVGEIEAALAGLVPF